MSKDKMPTVVVDVDKWCRGGKGGKSALLNEEGNKCCLGFATEQLADCKLPAPERVGFFGTPVSYSRYAGKSVPLLTEGWSSRSYIHSPGLGEMMGVNDDPNITDSTRMRKLRALAKKAGFKFSFKGARKASAAT